MKDFLTTKEGTHLPNDCVGQAWEEAFLEEVDKVFELFGKTRSNNQAKITLEQWQYLFFEMERSSNAAIKCFIEFLKAGLPIIDLCGDTPTVQTENERLFGESASLDALSPIKEVPSPGMDGSFVLMDSYLGEQSMDMSAADQSLFVAPDVHATGQIAEEHKAPERARETPGAAARAPVEMNRGVRCRSPKPEVHPETPSKNVVRVVQEPAQRSLHTANLNAVLSQPNMKAGLEMARTFLPRAMDTIGHSLGPAAGGYFGVRVSPNTMLLRYRGRP
jgi:hypothetical protein